jgi:predicted transcriptional regulator
VFYVENGCLFAKQYHHDGVNSEVYTRIKEGAPDEIYDNPEEMRAEELIKWTEKFGEELLK